MNVPKVGQIYQEVDPRFLRFVKVMDVYRIAGAAAYIVRIKNLKTERVTEADSRRFNGKSRGYKLVSVEQMKALISKIEFKVGEKVLTFKNYSWGRHVMEVTQVTEGCPTVSCKSPEFGIGAFDRSELIRANSKEGRSRLLKIKKLLELEKQINQVHQSLFGN